MLVAVSVLALVAFVAVVDGPALAGPAPAPPASASPAATGTWTFGCTAAPERFTVPAGITHLRADAQGGHGGSLAADRGGIGGPAGRTVATFSVSAGQALDIYVGCAGRSGSDSSSAGWGYGSGGQGGHASSPQSYDGAGGGGSSAVYDPAATTVLVGAGGGGGAAGNALEGIISPCMGLCPRTAGGNGGAGGNPGAAGQPQRCGNTCGGPTPGCVNCSGDTAGADGGSSEDGGAGGGGGGGFAGGGGGGGAVMGGNSGAGGGGGLSLVDPSVTAVGYVTSALTGDGQVILTAGEFGTQAFGCVGGAVYATVPPDVTQMTIEAHGAQGAAPRASGYAGGRAGFGGIMIGTVSVTPGDQLVIDVGCQPPGNYNYGYGSGGYGGHAAAPEARDGAAGGGGTAVFAMGGNELLVAAGGGGGGGGGGFTGSGGDGGDGGGWSNPLGSPGHNGDGGGSGDGGCVGCSTQPAGPNGADGTGSNVAESAGGGGGGGGGGQGGALGHGGSTGGGGGGGGAGGSAGWTPTASDLSGGIDTNGGDGSAVLSWLVPPPPPGRVTFACTGARQQFTVPAQITALGVEVRGGQGGTGGPSAAQVGGSGGLGGAFTATVPVTPGAVLAVDVPAARGRRRRRSGTGAGGQRRRRPASDQHGQQGGGPGGGAGGCVACSDPGGGGGSDSGGAGGGGGGGSGMDAGGGSGGIGGGGAGGAGGASATGSHVTEVRAATPAAGDGELVISWGGASGVTLPVRVADTRDGTGGIAAQQVQPGTVLRITVSRTVPIPAGVHAAVLNVTAAAPSASGYLTVFACGTPALGTSNVNYTAGEPAQTNTVITGFDVAGSVCVTAYAPVDVVVDLTAWLSSRSGYVPAVPVRLADTRDGTGTARQPLRPGEVLAVTVPGTGAVAAALNVTAANTSAAGYLTVFPCGGVPPNTSSVNYGPGEAGTSNTAITPLGSGGKACITTFTTVDVVVDLQGVFSADGHFQGSGPTRVYDTRNGTGGAPKRRVVPRDTAVVRVVDAASAPGLAAVSLNITATDAAADGYLTVFRCGDAEPYASAVTYAFGAAAPNAVVVAPSPEGTVCITTFAPVDVVVDITGVMAF